jgi:hypothetical protein
MGVHFLTFHALSLKLYEEKYGLTSHMICDDFFFTEMIRHILRTEQCREQICSVTLPEHWKVQAIWRTMQGTERGKVEPGNVIDGIGDGLFEPDDCEVTGTAGCLQRNFFRGNR